MCFLTPDKGNAVVVVNKTDYIKGHIDIINYTKQFAKFASDPTINSEGSLQRFLCSLKKNNKIDKDIYNSIYPSSSLPAHIYALS